MQAQDEAIDVHDWTSGTTTTCGSTGLVVARIEIGISLFVIGCVSVKTADEARQDTELLTGVVTDNSDFNTNY